MNKALEYSFFSQLIFRREGSEKLLRKNILRRKVQVQTETCLRHIYVSWLIHQFRRLAFESSFKSTQIVPKFIKFKSHEVHCKMIEEMRERLKFCGIIRTTAEPQRKFQEGLLKLRKV